MAEAIPNPRERMRTTAGLDGLEHIFLQTSRQLLPADAGERMEHMLSQLDHCYRILENMNYRIGYLESQLATHQKADDRVEELQGTASQAPALEDQNKVLRSQFVIAQQQVEAGKMIQMQNAELRQRLEELERTYPKWWKRAFYVLIGEETSELPQKHSMSDYYSMLNKAIRDGQVEDISLE